MSAIVHTILNQAFKVTLYPHFCYLICYSIYFVDRDQLQRQRLAMQCQRSRLLLWIWLRLVGVLHIDLEALFQKLEPLLVWHTALTKTYSTRWRQMHDELQLRLWVSLLCESSHLIFRKKKGLHPPAKNSTCTRTTPCHTSIASARAIKTAIPDSSARSRCWKGLTQ